MPILDDALKYINKGYNSEDEKLNDEVKEMLSNITLTSENPTSLQLPTLKDILDTMEIYKFNSFASTEEETPSKYGLKVGDRLSIENEDAIVRLVQCTFAPNTYLPILVGGNDVDEDELYYADAYGEVFYSLDDIYVYYNDAYGSDKIKILHS